MSLKLPPLLADLLAGRANSTPELEQRLARFGRILIAVVLCGYGAWEILFLLRGSPLIYCHDELNYIYEALRLPGERRLSGYTHGVVIYELVAIMEIGWYAVARLLGQVSSSEEFVASVIQNLDAHLIGARIIIGIAALLFLFQLYRLGRHFGGPAVGALASLLAATNLTTASLATSCKEEVVYWLLLVTGLELAWRAARTLDYRKAILAGAAIGAASVTKYLGVFGFVACVVPLLHAPRMERKRALRVGVAMGLAGGITVLVLMPFLLTDTATVLASLRSLNEGAVKGLAASLSMRAYLGYHLPNILGWLVIALGTCELVLRVRRERRGPVLLLVSPLTFLVLMGMRPGFSQAYYVMPLSLFLMILTSSLAARIARTGRLGRAALVAPFAVIAIAAFSPTFFPGAVKHGILLLAPDTRLEAQAWLEKHAAPGSCVTVTAAVSGENTQGPPLRVRPDRLPPGGGVFRRARKLALERAGGPYYDVRVIDIYRYEPSKVTDCEWVVIPSLAPGPPSEIEFGRGGRDDGGMGREEESRPPPGYVKVAEFRAFPEWRSFLQPFYSHLDYQELRTISIAQMWRDARYGRTQTIYRKAGAGGATP